MSAGGGFDLGTRKGISSPALLPFVFFVRLWCASPDPDRSRFKAKLLSRPMVNILCAGHNQVGSQADERAVFHGAGAAGQRGGQLRRIGNRAKGAVEDYVAGVRSRTGY
jgi:hypothetical protein